MVSFFNSPNFYNLDLSENLEIKSNKLATVEIRTDPMTAYTFKSATNQDF